MESKDQVIGTVWKLFDLHPPVYRDAAKKSMDLHAKNTCLAYAHWCKLHSGNNKVMALSEEERFDIFYNHVTN